MSRHGREVDPSSSSIKFYRVGSALPSTNLDLADTKVWPQKAEQGSAVYVPTESTTLVTTSFGSA